MLQPFMVPKLSKADSILLGQDMAGEKVGMKGSLLVVFRHVLELLGVPFALGPSMYCTGAHVHDNTNLHIHKNLK